jgi:uncharacterized protein GlcG (DUF336 family)
VSDVGQKGDRHVIRDGVTGAIGVAGAMTGAEDRRIGEVGAQEFR